MIVFNGNFNFFRLYVEFAVVRFYAVTSGRNGFEFKRTRFIGCDVAQVIIFTFEIDKFRFRTIVYFDFLIFLLI